MLAFRKRSSRRRKVRHGVIRRAYPEQLRQSRSRMATKGQLDGEWYSETSELWPGQAMSLKVPPPPRPALLSLPEVTSSPRRFAQIKSMLHECKSEFQDVQVWLVEASSLCAPC